MNRIILIGNGFDLAHGIHTSYNHFLKDYWENIITELQNTANRNITDQGMTFENEEIKVVGIYGPWGGPTKIDATNFEDLLTNLKSQNVALSFKNKFFRIISDKSYIQNWVDVENEYYSLLKSTFNNHNSSAYGSDVERLNSDFEKVKHKLIDYLKKVESKFNENLDSNFSETKNIIGYKIYHPFKLKDFSESSLNQKAEIEYNFIKKDIEALASGEITMGDLDEYKKRLIQKIGTKKPLAEIKKLLQSDYATDYFDLIPDQTIFLNFNYTFTDKKYNNPREFNQFDDDKYTSVKSIHIHGTTDNGDNNPVIFGFGDEIDDDYKSIEKLNDNKYLENIKSINYLETDNYKNLLEYINSGNFQIFIFGHSCGISDRTLLNTIFEHENCASIKLFYHKKAEGIDNYSDIIRNISRNFNDKAKMRDRVVNKNYSEQLR